MARLERNLTDGHVLTEDGNAKTQHAFAKLKRAKEDYQRRLAVGGDILTVQADYSKTCQGLM